MYTRGKHHQLSARISPHLGARRQVLAHIMQVHYKLNVAVVGHNIPGVVEYDPAISAQSFSTIDALFAKMVKSGAYTHACIHAYVNGPM